MSYIRNASEDLVYNSSTGSYDLVSSTTYTLTIEPTPSDATVTFSTGSVSGNSVTVPVGTSVTYTVSKANYTTQSDTITVYEDQTINVSLVLNTHTITINPTPADATVVLTATGYSQVGNSITVPYGTQVSYSVSKEHYNTVSNSFSVTASQEIPITLSLSQYTLTINPNPIDATVVLTATGYSQVGNSITVPYGTRVSYEVSKEGYQSIINTIEISEDTTLSIELLSGSYTFTIVPNPSDSTVILTSPGYTQVGNSITVPAGSTVSYSVTRAGYFPQSGTRTIDDNVSLTITLEYDSSGLQRDGIVRDTDLGKVTGSLEATLDLGQVGDSTITATNDLGRDLASILYTQTRSPYINDNVFTKIGKIVSWVLTYDSSTQKMTITDFPSMQLSSNTNEYLEWSAELQKYIQPITITIVPNPDTARVSFTIDGNEYVQRSITVNRGTTLTYTVSQIGYHTQSVNMVADVNSTINVNLVMQIFTLTIAPDPADATVVLTAAGYEQVDNSITVPYGTSVSYIVSKEGYQPKSETLTVTSNITKTVVLLAAPYTSGDVLFESNTPGTYTFTPEVPCLCEVIAVGGGGGGAAARANRMETGHSVTGSVRFFHYFAHYVAGGGSGYASDTNISLSTTEYTIIVGSGGSGVDGGTTATNGGSRSATGNTGGSSSVGSLVSVNGGTGGYAYASSSPSGSSTGGSGYQNGGSSGANYNKKYPDSTVSASGGAGYQNKGAGGGASINSSSSVSVSSGAAGYVKIIFISYP